MHIAYLAGSSPMPAQIYLLRAGSGRSATAARASHFVLQPPALGTTLWSMRRTYKQSGDRLSNTSGLVLRSSAQLLHHLSVQFSVFVALVMICFLFRAGYELCTTMHQTFHRLNTGFPAGIPLSLRSGETVRAATTVLFWVMFRFCFFDHFRFGALAVLRRGCVGVPSTLTPSCSATTISSCLIAKYVAGASHRCWCSESGCCAVL